MSTNGTKWSIIYSCPMASRAAPIEERERSSFSPLFAQARFMISQVHSVRRF